MVERAAEVGSTPVLHHHRQLPGVVGRVRGYAAQRFRFGLLPEFLRFDQHIPIGIGLCRHLTLQYFGGFRSYSTEYTEVV